MLQLPSGTPAAVVATAQAQAIRRRPAIGRTGETPAAGPGAEGRPLPMPEHPLT